MQSLKSLIIGNSYLKFLMVIIVVIVLQHLFLYAKIYGVEKDEITKPKWQFTAYNFGGLEKLKPKEQIHLLNGKGYKGIILRGATEENVQDLDVFILESRKIEDFNIQSVFIRYNFQDSEIDQNRWKTVVDKIAGSQTQLWVIFGKKAEGINDDYIENKLHEIVQYSSQKDVEVILYPHSKCYIESAEEALPFVEKIDSPNLNLAFHLYHEIRAGNGSRIPDVFEKIKENLGAVTMAGTDSIADFSKPKAMVKSTIKLIGQGNFDMNNFIVPLSKSGYKGFVGFMNFKIEEKPELYLDSSIKEWEKLISMDLMN